MKKLVLFFYLSLACYQIPAAVHTVNNIPFGPGQFSSLQSAINAAAPSDTLMIWGSDLPYGAFNLDKYLVFIGHGINPDAKHKGKSILGQPSVSIGGDSSVYNGITFLSATIDFQGGTFQRCAFAGTNISINSNTPQPLLFIGCCFYLSSFTLLGGADIEVFNSVWYGRHGSTGSLLTVSDAITSSIRLSHCYIRYDDALGSNTMFSLSVNAQHVFVLNNSIIDSPGSVFPTLMGGNATMNGSLSVVSNNVYSPGINFALLPNVNGISNIAAAPQLDSVFFSNIANAGLYINDINKCGFRPQPSSPCFNAASDGSHIGPAGGPFPIYSYFRRKFTGEPPIPQSKDWELQGNGNVPFGGNVDIRIEVKSID